MNGKQVMKQLILFLFQFKLYLFLALACAILSVALNVYAPLLIGDILDAITSQPLSITLRLLCYLVIVYLFYSIFQWGMMYFSNKIAFSSSSVLRKQLYEKLSHLPISFYDTHARGDLISRFVNDIDFISDGFLQGLSTMMSGVTTIVLAIIFMIDINWIMSINVILSAPFTYIVASFITKRSQRYFRKNANALGALNGYSEEMLSGIKTIKAYHYEKQANQNFQEMNQALYEAGVQSQFYGSLANPSTRFVTNFTYALTGAAGAFLALQALITIGNISSFLMYANLFSKPFTEITGVMTQLQTALASARRIFTILDMKEECDTQGIPFTPTKGSIEFSHVSFGYDAHRQLMKDINLIVSPGEKVAIVGKTGAGKTTLVNLLLRFYEINHGHIYVDGMDIQKISKDDLRRSFGVVLQDTYLFEGSIRENIAYGKPDATNEEIISAAKKSGAHEFIRHFPQGYDTKLHTNSNTLSSGQKQLLSLTRVLLMNPKILILDEATSNMDTISEQHVNQAMEILMKEKTSFVIAHRLSTILDADKILVMEQGNIIETGNHAELMKKQGTYYTLFNSQFTS